MYKVFAHVSKTARSFLRGPVMVMLLKKIMKHQFQDVKVAPDEHHLFYVSMSTVYGASVA